MATRQEASTGKMVTDSKPAEQLKPDEMHIKVYSPFQTYFDDIAQSISAVNDVGPFDILPQHHNFLTLLNQCDVVIQTKQDKRTIKISRGLMHVKADRVVVFLDV